MRKQHIGFLIVTVSVLILVMLAGHMTNEYFMNSVSDSVLMTQFLNHADWVVQATPNGSDWAPKEATDDQVLLAHPGQLVMAYDNDPIQGEVLASKKAYFVSLASPDVAFHIDCGFDFGGMTIGYFDRVDLSFIKALIYGYRMPRRGMPKLVRLSMSDLTLLNKRLASASNPGDIDLIITCIIPQSPFHKYLQTQRISVMGFRTLDIDRVNVFQPTIKLENVKLHKVFSGVGMISPQDDDNKLPVIIARVIRVGSSSTRAMETFITRLDMNVTTTDPSYKCYGDDKIDIRALCESAYDVDGLPKKGRKTVWDHMCQKDADCPFYDQSQNRGTCGPYGLCELPVAVKRLGYRKYDATGVHQPFTRDGKFIFSSL